jgi:uncharacterized protein (TIGR01777 family)
MKILVSGASGLVGRHLKKSLEFRGHEVFTLSRSPKQESDIAWNPERLEVDSERLKPFEGIIHLAGENIAGSRWTDEKKRKIYSSRVQGTQFLVDSILKARPELEFFISASAVGYYGNRDDEELTEKSQPGSGFLAELCVEWEKASEPLVNHSCRVCWARIGIVLSTEGGALEKMLTPFRLGLGGNMGSGRQWFPWIDIDDLTKSFVFLTETTKASGAFNLTAPEIVRQSEFAQTLAAYLQRPSIFHAPSFLLKIALGEMGEELLLSSMKVRPEKLLQLGFEFQYPELKNSLKHLLNHC